MALMNTARVFKLVVEFLGFLLVSTGGSLLATAVLLALSGAAPETGNLASTAWWLGVVSACGLGGTGMMAAGVRLVRRSK